MAVRIKPSTNPDKKSIDMLEGVKKMLGSTPNIFTTMAHSPAVLEFYLNGVSALNGTKIPGALREQLALTTAGTNSCDYCASAHTALGKMQKISDSELALNLTAKSSDAKTQAALSFAQKIVRDRGMVSDSDMKSVREAGFSDPEILEIVAVTCQNIFTNYFNHIVGTEVDFPLVNSSGSSKAK